MCRYVILLSIYLFLMVYFLFQFWSIVKTKFIYTRTLCIFFFCSIEQEIQSSVNNWLAKFNQACENRETSATENNNRFLSRWQSHHYRYFYRFWIAFSYSFPSNVKWMMLKCTLKLHVHWHGNWITQRNRDMNLNRRDINTYTHDTFCECPVIVHAFGYFDCCFILFRFIFFLFACLSSCLM